MSHEDVAPCDPDTVVQFYLPAPEDHDPVTWFDANSDDDSEGIEDDFTARLLGGGDVKNKDEPLTAATSYAAMTPGIFAFLCSVGAVAYGNAFIVPVALSVMMIIGTSVGIYKVCGTKWYWMRLWMLSFVSIVLLTVMGCVVGQNVQRLKVIAAQKVFEGVNPADAPVGHGIYHFAKPSVVNPGHIKHYTNRQSKGYDESRTSFCVAPVTNSILTKGRTVSYFVLNQGTCCQSKAIRCWPGMTESSEWAGQYLGPASKSNGITMWAKNSKIVVPPNAVLIKVIPASFKTDELYHIGVFSVVPFILLAALPICFRSKGNNDKNGGSYDSLPNKEAATK